MELLQPYECDNIQELNKKEGEIIRKFNADDNYTVINKYIAGRDNNQYYQENTNKEKNKKYTLNKKTQIKSNRTKYNIDKRTGMKSKRKIRLYYQENADKIKEQAKQYNQENTDKIKEKRKQYYQENADEIKER
jgi:hypothetical protein